MNETVAEGKTGLEKLTGKISELDKRLEHFKDLFIGLRNNVFNGSDEEKREVEKSISINRIHDLELKIDTCTDTLDIIRAVFNSFDNLLRIAPEVAEPKLSN